MQTQQTQVPFEKLTAPSNINARDEKDTAYKDVSDLVSSIKAVGLLQPLVVRPNGSTYEVLAGKRRFTAIAQLRKSGDWPASQAVPVVVKGLDDDEALEASFIENTARRAMHPVREYEVFTKLHSTGDKAKKTELAELAATEATKRGWLPVELRHPAYKLRK